MKSKKTVILIILLFLTVFSCTKKETPETLPMRADSLANIQKETLVPADAPSWYLAKPETEGYAYGRGMARSRRVNIARDKAVLKAQAELAELIKTDSTLATPVELKNTRIKEQTQVREGKQWRVYVLLEAPVLNE